MRNHTEKSTYYALCKKTDTDVLVSNELFNNDGSIAVCNDAEEAYTVVNPDRLFFMLEEYSARFKNDYTVIKVEEVKRTEYTISTTESEKKKFFEGR